MCPSGKKQQQGFCKTFFEAHCSVRRGSAWDIKWQIKASALPETVKFNSGLAQREGTSKETLSLLPNHATPSGTEKDFAKNFYGGITRDFKKIEQKNPTNSVNLKHFQKISYLSVARVKLEPRYNNTHIYGETFCNFLGK